MSGLKTNPTPLCGEDFIEVGGGFVLLNPSPALPLNNKGRVIEILIFRRYS